MTQSIHSLTVDELAWMLERFPFTRHVSAIHLDHTQSPDQTTFRGRESIEDLHRLHTEGYGFQSFAQHATVDPEGRIWVGRNWNLPPASAPGHNGNESDGPFLLALIGNFDFGYDSLEDPQRSATIQAIALLQHHFDLPLESLRFQRHLVDDISGPGSSIEYDGVIKELRKERTRLRKTRDTETPAPLSDRDEHELTQLITQLSGDLPANREAANAGIRGDGMNGHDFTHFSRSAAPIGFNGSRSSRGDLNTAIIEAVRPHVVNLRLGRFSDDGEISTVPSDVDAIFEEHLERALAGQKAQGKKLHLLFYAHGGLVAEKNALLQAHAYIRHWRKNGIYPIYFVWETGLKETLSQLLFGASRQLQRSGARAAPTDWFVEVLARRLGGPLVWSGMKTSARLASEEGGGAHYVARKLVDFVKAHPDDVDVHAAGHSAGSIFQNHFLPTAFEFGLEEVKSLHLLAPAVTVEDFNAGLGPFLNEKVAHTTIFTLKRAFELADDSAKVYHKSLLYLLYYALEARKRTPILGLEISLRADRDLKRHFGLGRTLSKRGEVVWSPSGEVTSGRSASQAQLHGDFDNDSATLNSMVRRILDLDDDDPIQAIPALGGGRSARWSEEIEWPPELAELFRPQPFPGPDPTPVSPPSSDEASEPTIKPVPPSVGGRRRALCVGIDDYAEAPLSGCVADARLWSDTLGSLGFDTPRLLTNAEATHDSILAALTELIESSRAGDVVVFQFAGHGIFLPDLSGDEAGEDTAEHDEALCPYDYGDGAYIIDDDIAEVFARIPSGVNVTCFMDCCHSGTVSRLGIGLTQSQRSGDGSDRRARYLKTTARHVEAHEAFRARKGKSRSAVSRGPDSMREVLFSACRSNEVAWESNGHGEFTLNATAILKKEGIGLAHEEFERKVIATFGATPRQRPQLDCAPALRSAGLLHPVASGAPEPIAVMQPKPVGDSPSMAQFISQLQAVLAQWSQSS